MLHFTREVTQLPQVANLTPKKNKKMAKLFRHAGERIQPGEAHFTMDRGSGCIETFTDMFGDVLLASKFPDASFL